MKPLPLGILLASGLLAGSVAQRLASRPASVETREPKATKFIREEAVAPVVPASADTVESLKDPHAPQRISRTALWLKDASLADIEALWKEIRKEWPPSGDLNDLILGRWVMIDPKHALAHGHTEGNAFGVWSAWASADPQAAYEAARASGEAQAMDAVISVMALHDPEHVLGLLEKGENINIGTGSNLVNGLMTRGQYERAIRTLQLYTNAGSGESTDMVFGEWIKKEPEAALQWMVQNPRGISGSWLDRAMVPLVGDDPNHMWSLFAKLPTGGVRARLESSFIQALAERNPDAAREMAAKTPSLAGRVDLLAAVGLVTAKSKPKEAAGILRSLLDLGVSPKGQIVTTFYPGGVQKCPDGNGMSSYFMDEITRLAPAAALDEMMVEPENKLHRETAGKIAGEWMEKDAWEFSKWLKEQAAGETRDAMALALARRITLESSQPAFKEAVEWAASVGDPVERERSVVELVRYWSMEDGEGLESYLGASGTPAAVKEIAGKLRNR